VTALETEAGRFPWTTCPEATAVLRVLEGTSLSTRCTDLARHADPKAQLTFSDRPAELLRGKP
jgi:hypothetical protein